MEVGILEVIFLNCDFFKFCEISAFLLLQNKNPVKKIKFYYSYQSNFFQISGNKIPPIFHKFALFYSCLQPIDVILKWINILNIFQEMLNLNNYDFLMTISSLKQLLDTVKHWYSTTEGFIGSTSLTPRYSKSNQVPRVSKRFFKNSNLDFFHCIFLVIFKYQHRS